MRKIQLPSICKIRKIQLPSICKIELQALYENQYTPQDNRSGLTKLELIEIFPELEKHMKEIPDQCKFKLASITKT